MPTDVERPKYLNELLSEVDSMDETLFPPRHKIGPHDRAIGTIVGWPRKLLALANFYSREVERIGVEVKYAEDPASLDLSYVQSTVKKDMALEIFWGCARHQLGYWQHGAIGIRENWVFVEVTNPAEHLIHNLFGIGG